ncbi:hypothetical protein GCM10011581_49160 [Saccharopolyspora subtropica]|uniref:DUF3558 domain-containing protein n=1 Tax=Saccharopolyspora thermophila TaxID=89367 RepID=A0A917NJW8_9PSEU|nr:DUF3558 family protein [Saccharopolyspora subtropica]GGJ06388.1 hypothetical protein GCM10011581_49160 [Saccharopolyspora subtropica]
MPRRLAIGVVLTGLLLGGCSSQAAEQPARTAPAKSLDVNACHLLTPTQRHTLGLDQPPKPEGPTCHFEASANWAASVAVDTQRPFAAFTAAQPRAQRLDLAGYPAAKVNNAHGCTIVVDVADEGTLRVEALVRQGAPTAVGTSCDAARRITEATLHTLPTA